MSRSWVDLKSQRLDGGGVQHVVICDGCGVTAKVLCASDLPHDWGAFIEHGVVRHYCARCNEDLEAAVALPAAARR
jgi:hypothetical protein